MITQKEMRVDQKFIPEYYIPDCVNYYFTSNHPDAFIVDEYDRRYFIHEVSLLPLSHDFFDMYDEWLWVKGGPAALFAHLLQVDCRGFNPNGVAPWTDAKKEMVRFSRTDVASWVAELKDNPDDVLPNGRDLHTASDLLMYYAGGSTGDLRIKLTGFSKELKRSQVVQLMNGNPLKNNKTGKSYRLYAVRNADYWQRATIREALDHYEGKHE